MIGPFEPMPSGTGIAPPRCHPPPDGGTLRHVNNSLPGLVSEGLVHGNGSRQPDNWLSALAEPFVTILAHGNGVTAAGGGTQGADVSGAHSLLVMDDKTYLLSSLHRTPTDQKFNLEILIQIQTLQIKYNLDFP